MVTRAVAGILIALLTGLLGGCGGGSGNTTTAEGGIGGTGKSVGTVSGFGSVFVGGVEYDTTNAVITVDGQPCSGCRDYQTLGIGMVVTVTGTVNSDGVTGTASSIAYTKALFGPVVQASIGVGGFGYFTVLGQTVNVDANTVYDYGSSGYQAPTDIPQDQNVLIQVSGYSDGAGNIYATRIAVGDDSGNVFWNAGTAVELKGTVSIDSNSSAPFTFNIGGLVVDYSAVSDQSAIVDGNYVTVKGSSFDQANSLLASTVELEGDGSTDFGEDEDDAKVQGIITGALSGDLFMLNGGPVRLTDSVQYSNGGVDTLSLIGTSVEVEGRISGGELLAKEIKIRASTDNYYKLESHVQQVTPSGSSCYTGTIKLMDQVINVTTSTTLQDDASEEPYFNLCSLTAGSTPDYIEVRVYDSGGTWVASKLERKRDEGNSDEIEGMVDSVNGSQATIAGIVVEFSPSSPPSVGTKVEVTGTYSSGIFTVVGMDQDD